MPKILRRPNSTPLTPAQFNRLSKRKKRMAVVADAIAQIKAGHYRSKRGTYAETDGSCSIEQKNLTSQEPPRCTVCGTGALLVSIVRFANKFDEYAAATGQLIRRLSPLFTQLELSVVEAAFEKTNTPNLGRTAFSWGGQWAPDELLRRARKFGRRYSTDKKRALGIFRNMLRNHGIFKP